MSQQTGSNQDNQGADGGKQEETTPLKETQTPPTRPSRSHHTLRFRILRVLYKCMDILTRRAIVLIFAILTNILVLVCVVSAQFGIVDTSLNLQGTDLELVRDMDTQFSQKKLPGMYGGVIFSLILGLVSLVFVVFGSKPPLQMSQNWMKAAFGFQVVGAVLYVIAVSVYLHFVIQVNSSDECKQRERIYSRNGYTWMNCDVSGADAAAALFGLITAILYTAGAVFTFQTDRRVSRFIQERDEEAKKQRNQ
uniref:Si:ch211-191a24.4 n=1 Tax=Oryzias latipes TaxID=8090 RepID=A0A3P9K0V6_ORYLA